MPNFLEIWNEIIMMLCSFHLMPWTDWLCQNMEYDWNPIDEPKQYTSARTQWKSEYSCEEMQYMIGWSFIIIISLNIFFNLFFVVLKIGNFFKLLYMKLSNLCKGRPPPPPPPTPAQIHKIDKY